MAVAVRRKSQQRDGADSRSSPTTSSSSSDASNNNNKASQQPKQPARHRTATAAVVLLVAFCASVRSSSSSVEAAAFWGPGSHNRRRPHALQVQQQQQQQASTTSLWSTRLNNTAPTTPRLKNFNPQKAINKIRKSNKNHKTNIGRTMIMEANSNNNADSSSSSGSTVDKIREKLRSNTNKGNRKDADMGQQIQEVMDEIASAMDSSSDATSDVSTARDDQADDRSEDGKRSAAAAAAATAAEAKNRARSSTALFASNSRGTEDNNKTKPSNTSKKGLKARSVLKKLHGRLKPSSSIATPRNYKNRVVDDDEFSEKLGNQFRDTLSESLGDEFKDDEAAASLGGGDDFIADEFIGSNHGGGGDEFMEEEENIGGGDEFLLDNSMAPDEGNPVMIQDRRKDAAAAAKTFATTNKKSGGKVRDTMSPDAGNPVMIKDRTNTPNVKRVTFSDADRLPVAGKEDMFGSDDAAVEEEEEDEKEASAFSFFAKVAKPKEKDSGKRDKKLSSPAPVGKSKPDKTTVSSSSEKTPEISSAASRVKKLYDEATAKKEAELKETKLKEAELKETKLKETELKETKASKLKDAAKKSPEPKKALPKEKIPKAEIQKEDTAVKDLSPKSVVNKEESKASSSSPEISDSSTEKVKSVDSRKVNTVDSKKAKSVDSRKAKMDVLDESPPKKVLEVADSEVTSKDTVKASLSEDDDTKPVSAFGIKEEDASSTNEKSKPISATKSSDPIAKESYKVDSSEAKFKVDPDSTSKAESLDGEKSSGATDPAESKESLASKQVVREPVAKSVKAKSTVESLPKDKAEPVTTTSPESASEGADTTDANVGSGSKSAAKQFSLRVGNRANFADTVVNVLKKTSTGKGADKPADTLDVRSTPKEDIAAIQGTRKKSEEKKPKADNTLQALADKFRSVDVVANEKKKIQANRPAKISPSSGASASKVSRPAPRSGTKSPLDSSTASTRTSVPQTRASVSRDSPYSAAKTDQLAQHQAQQKRRPPRPAPTGTTDRESVTRAIPYAAAKSDELARHQAQQKRREHAPAPEVTTKREHRRPNPKRSPPPPPVVTIDRDRNRKAPQAARAASGNRIDDTNPTPKAGTGSSTPSQPVSAEDKFTAMRNQFMTKGVFGGDDSAAPTGRRATGSRVSTEPYAGGEMSSTPPATAAPDASDDSSSAAASSSSMLGGMPYQPSFDVGTDGPQMVSNRQVSPVPYGMPADSETTAGYDANTAPPPESDYTEGGQEAPGQILSEPYEPYEPAFVADSSGAGQVSTKQVSSQPYGMPSGGESVGGYEENSMPSESFPTQEEQQYTPPAPSSPEDKARAAFMSKLVGTPEVDQEGYKPSFDVGSSSSHQVSNRQVSTQPYSPSGHQEPVVQFDKTRKKKKYRPNDPSSQPSISLVSSGGEAQPLPSVGKVSSQSFQSSFEANPGDPQQLPTMPVSSGDSGSIMISGDGAPPVKKSRKKVPASYASGASSTGQVPSEPYQPSFDVGTSGPQQVSDRTVSTTPFQGEENVVDQYGNSNSPPQPDERSFEAPSMPPPAYEPYQPAFDAGSSGAGQVSTRQVSSQPYGMPAATEDHMGYDANTAPPPPPYTGGGQEAPGQVSSESNQPPFEVFDGPPRTVGRVSSEPYGMPSGAQDPMGYDGNTAPPPPSYTGGGQEAAGQVSSESYQPPFEVFDGPPTVSDEGRVSSEPYGMPSGAGDPMGYGANTAPPPPPGYTGGGQEAPGQFSSEPYQPQMSSQPYQPPSGQQETVVEYDASRMSSVSPPEAQKQPPTDPRSMPSVGRQVSPQVSGQTYETYDSGSGEGTQEYAGQYSSQPHAPPGAGNVPPIATEGRQEYAEQFPSQSYQESTRQPDKLSSGASLMPPATSVSAQGGQAFTEQQAPVGQYGNTAGVPPPNTVANAGTNMQGGLRTPEAPPPQNMFIPEMFCQFSTPEPTIPEVPRHGQGPAEHDARPDQEPLQANRDEAVRNENVFTMGDNGENMVSPPESSAYETPSQNTNEQYATSFGEGTPAMDNSISAANNFATPTVNGGFDAPQQTTAPHAQFDASYTSANLESNPAAETPFAPIASPPVSSQSAYSRQGQAKNSYLDGLTSQPPSVGSAPQTSTDTPDSSSATLSLAASIARASASSQEQSRGHPFGNSPQTSWTQPSDQTSRATSSSSSEAKDPPAQMKEETPPASAAVSSQSHASSAQSSLSPAYLAAIAASSMNKPTAPPLEDDTLGSFGGNSTSTAASAVPPKSTFGVRKGGVTKSYLDNLGSSTSLFAARGSGLDEQHTSSSGTKEKPSFLSPSATYEHASRDQTGNLPISGFSGARTAQADKVKPPSGTNSVADNGKAPGEHWSELRSDEGAKQGTPLGGGDPSFDRTYSQTTTGGSTAPSNNNAGDAHWSEIRSDEGPTRSIGTPLGGGDTSLDPGPPPFSGSKKSAKGMSSSSKWNPIGPNEHQDLSNISPDFNIS